MKSIFVRNGITKAATRPLRLSDPNQRFAIINKDGVVVNVIIGSIEGSIPVPESVPVEKGWGYADGKFIDTTPQPDINFLKFDAIERIDRQAERVRAAYVTSGSGQAMVYAEKANEAIRFSGEENPKPADYPLLAAEVGLTGQTLEDVAQAVMAKRSLWLNIAASIEKERLQAKRLVNAADDRETIQSVLSNLVWPEMPQ